MRVLHLITFLDADGAGSMLARLLAELDPAAYEPLVVAMLPPGPMGERIRALDADLLDLDMRKGRPTPLALHKLVAVLHEWHPDVVQTWQHHADLLGLAAARLAFPLGRRPAVAWNLRSAFSDLSRLDRSEAWTVRLCARLSGLPEVVVANSRAAVDRHIALGYRPRRFEIIPNGFDAGLFQPRASAPATLRRELGVSPESPLVGLAARFDPAKNQRGFLRAAGLVAKRLPETHFVCCGRDATPENAELTRWGEEAGLGGRLHLLGQREDMERFLAGLDLCVSASLEESFPNVLGEALCCGVPCVATDVGDSAALVGQDGAVAPPGDEQALARAMLRMLSLPATERMRMGGEGRMRMIRDYALESVVARYARLYDSLVSDGERRGRGRRKDGPAD